MMDNRKKNEPEYQRLRLPTEDRRNLEKTRLNMATPQSWQQEPSDIDDTQRLSLDDWQSGQPEYNPERQGQRRSDQLRAQKRRKRVMRRATPFKVFFTAFILFFIVLFSVVYFYLPQNDMVLILGLDRALEEDTWFSRSDTIIITQVKVATGEVSMLSIPRDLWVTIPGYGENRINTAHYFGEVYNPGTGTEVITQTIQSNFGVRIDHYVRLKLEEFPRLIDAMGGITVVLENPMGGLEAGSHKLNGTEALAFVRDRKGTDDFFRMQQGQVFLKAVINRLKEPGAWVRLPLIWGMAQNLVDTDIPVWLWPRYAVTLMRAVPDHMVNETLGREMVNPYITSEGANVLLPNWELIWAKAGQMFQ